MRLLPRHYVLLAIIVALFVFNIVRYRRREHAQTLAAQQNSAAAATAWAAFDKAAALRDAASADFQPAFNELRAATEGPATETPAASKDLADVRGCKTWLLFYRNPEWRQNAEKHVAACMKFHRDTTAS